MGKRGYRRKNLPEQAVEIAITGISHEGRGIGHINGKVAFVDGALPNEMIKAKYQRNRSQFSELKTLEVIKAASERVKPPCDYSEACGGCSLQHWQSGAQLSFKEDMLIDQLNRIANIQSVDFEILPQLQAHTLGYRRKARLAVRNVVKKGGVLIGFREKNSGFVMDMKGCEVLVEEVSCLLEPLRNLITSLDGLEEIPQIEVAVGELGPGKESGKIVALILRHLKKLSETDLKCLLKFAERFEVELYLQSGGMETVEKFFPSDDHERLYYYLPDYDLKMGFHPLDFTQINGELNTMIIDLAIGLLDLDQADLVLDLFCGLGNFTLPVARKAGAVVGIEGSCEMVERARENAQNNAVVNAEFHAADLYKSLGQDSWLSKTYNKIILDPPRSGALEIIPFLLKMNPEKILYISCNPATLARDAAELVSGGYKLKSVGVMDMFPHTSHVESIAEFVLK